jgi:hypothetical protein
MNWGKRILFLYLAFVSGIVFLVVKSHGREVALVANDYYQQELQYGDRMQAIKNYRTLKDGITLFQKSDIIKIAIPNDHSTCEERTIFFYKPSDPSADKIFELQPNEKGIIEIDKRLLQLGKYHVKIDWIKNGISYAFEEPIIIH